jgi:hypothetical protein
MTPPRREIISKMGKSTLAGMDIHAPQNDLAVSMKTRSDLSKKELGQSYDDNRGSASVWLFTV